jgi:hypothetical protein
MDGGSANSSKSESLGTADGLVPATEASKGDLVAGLVQPEVVQAKAQAKDKPLESLKFLRKYKIKLALSMGIYIVRELFLLCF